MVIQHIQVNKAQKQRRRTYRAHGRINRESLVVQQGFQAHVIARQPRVSAWPYTCLNGCYAIHKLDVPMQCKPPMLTPPDVAAYMSSPCHIELFLMEKDAAVKAEQVRPC